MKRLSDIAAAVALVCLGSASAQEQEQNEFLELATRKVAEYSAAFIDLTAQEKTRVEFLSESGAVLQKRDLESALIIYQSQSGAGGMTEYRDVLSVDGSRIRNHEQRAISLAQSLSNAASVAEELKRINDESNRYSDNLQMVNLTLMEGFPLREVCRSSFQLIYAKEQTVAGVPAHVYDYRQTGPCEHFTYRLMNLPHEFQSGAQEHRGRVWLDQQGRLLREERQVYVRSSQVATREVLALRTNFEYADSTFGIATPKRITTWMYGPVPPRSRTTEGAGPAWQTDNSLYPFVRVTQEYSKFSRFQVSVEEKRNEPLPKP